MIRAHFSCLTAVLLAFAFLCPVVGDAQVKMVSRNGRKLGRVIPTSVELAKHGIERSWWAQAGFDPRSDKLQSITADEQNVYVVSERGTMTAFDAESGNRRWVILLGGDNAPVLQPVSNSTQVLTAVGTSLVAIDKYNGDVQWKFRLKGQPATAPSVDDTNVYVGMLNGRVYAYNLRKVRELFNEGKMPEFSYNAQIWTYGAPSEITSPPGTSGRTVDFASRDGVFISISASDRQLQYLFETDGKILAPVARSGELAIIPSTDRNVYCINSRTGQVQWTFASGLPVLDETAIVYGRVYIAPRTLGLFQLDLENGRRQWNQRRASTYVASTSEYVYASDRLNNLLKLSAKTGRVEAEIPLNGYEHQVSNSRTDRIFLGTSTGLILCLHEQGRSFPSYHRYPERRPVLPGFAPDDPQPEDDTNLPDDSAEDAADDSTL